MNRLLSLDFYRSIAVLLVFFYHFYALFPESTTWLGIFRFGSLGVDIFFVLSGFLLAHTVWSSMLRGNFDLRVYFQKRFARIIPAYYVALGVGLLLVPVYLGSLYGLANILSHLVFVHNFVRDFHGAILGVGWTLGVEMQFYVLVPLLVWLFFSSKKRVLFLVVGGILCAWIYKYLLFTYFFPGWDFWDKFIYTTQLIGRIDQFVIGMGAYYVYKNFLESRSCLYSLPLWILSSVLLGSLLYLHSYVGNIYWDSLLLVVFESTWVAIAVVAGLLTSLKLGGVIKSIVTHTVFVRIAQYSYGIYLWHLLIMNQLLLLELPWQITLVYSVILTGIFSVVSYHLIELPFLRGVRKEEKQIPVLP